MKELGSLALERKPMKLIEMGYMDTENGVKAPFFNIFMEEALSVLAAPSELRSRADAWLNIAELMMEVP